MNRLRERLAAKRRLVGGGVSLGDPQVSEALGLLYDFLWIDMEHTGMDCATVRGHLIAARASGCPAMVRVAWNDPVLVKPVLDMGPEAVVFPQVGGLADARRALESCRYPPRGCRGWGPIRALDYGEMAPEAYRESEDEGVFPILQLENLEFLGDLDEILQLEGLGAVCVGPNDLSAALGRLGALRDGELLAILDLIAEKTARHGVPLMVSCGYHLPTLTEWVKRGARLLQVGADYALMLAEAGRQISAMESLQ